MAFKGFFKAIKKEVTNEIGRQIDKAVNKKGGGSSGDDQIMPVNMSAVEGVLGLLGGGGGGSSASGLQNLLNTIQNLSGGQLPTNVGNLLPGILKVAEIIGHGMGDDTPRTEQNADGSFIDGFIKTIVGGRKIHGGKGSTKARQINVDQSYGQSRAGIYGGTQDYKEIQSKCLNDGVLFEDPEFPAEDASVFFSKSEARGFQWMRPHEITSDPQFFVSGASRFDVKQGELGDCWLLAAVANLTLNEKLSTTWVPEDKLVRVGLLRVFHFRFWQYGQWVDVVIDDRLPTKYGKLVFMHSEDSNEFWSALLEKAYAKLHGSYGR
ncbi:Calpain-A [Orchesella cincta]|uniref:Calpain-A n=1 Tax=Orchesella cincta TaxID=48709 RepID=A0A1D2MWM1_ORCCI|nr:Calpain-A [Orchesella cincta]